MLKKKFSIQDESTFYNQALSDLHQTHDDMKMI